MDARALLTLLLASSMTGCTLNIQAPTPSPSNAPPATAPAPASVPGTGAAAAPVGAPAKTPAPDSESDYWEYLEEQLRQENQNKASAKPPAVIPETETTGDGPTKEEVTNLVRSMFTATYQETWMKDDEFSIEFTDYQTAPKTQKNLFGGHFDQPIDVWPIRMNVNIKWQKGEDVRAWKRGTQINESFSFYRDEFGGWNYRTSGL